MGALVGQPHGAPQLLTDAPVYGLPELIARLSAARADSLVPGALTRPLRARGLKFPLLEAGLADPSRINCRLQIGRQWRRAAVPI